MVQVTLQSVQMSDGETVQIPDDGVVILVGPNNAGKSQFLRDIVGLLNNPESFNSKTLLSLEILTNNLVGVEDWILRELPHVERNGTSLVQVEGWGEVGPTDIANQWNHATSRNRLGPLTSLFTLHADGNSRLTSANPQPNINFASQLPNSPIQHAYAKPEIEEALSTQAEAAFGYKVSIERWAGAELFLRIGDPPVFQGSIHGAPSSEFLTARSQLPILHEQGDGIRSYIGLLLNLFAGRYQIYLVDEPEAFLHPPQARRLGRVLAEQTEGKQAIIATHSSAILQGALEAEKPTTIVRVTRQGNVNHAAVIAHTALSDLWSDPLLRYSNLFDGLFHDAVVLCEADSDCRYYSAVLDQLGNTGSSRIPQIQFSHCGGKSRMPNVVSALHAAKVPVIVVTDIDFLREKPAVRKLVAEMGGDFDLVESRWNVLNAAVLATNKPLRSSDVRDKVDHYIDTEASSNLTPGDLKKLSLLLKHESGWQALKRSGSSAVPQGDATAAYYEINAYLETLGILVVPVGELERFEPDIPNHGPAWVTAVFERGRHKSPSTSSQSFAKAILETAKNLSQNEK